MDIKDPVMFDVKRIEGRRWHSGVGYWSTPASLRAWNQLEALGFRMYSHGGGLSYVNWLARNCDVPPIEGVNPLFPYQRVGVSRLLTRSKMILADDPGLGKTWQAIEWGKRTETKKLVLAPKVVLTQWRDQIEGRYLAENNVTTTHTRAAEWDYGWNIVNPEFLPKLKEPEQPFDLIVDEAHLMTNMKSARTKRTLALADASKRVLLLTGTPPAKPVKLWPFLLMTGERTPKEFFPYALRYCGAEKGDYGWDFGGATHMDELKDELVHVMLRRTKEEVMEDLPELLERTIKVEDSKMAERTAISKLDAIIQDQLDRGHRNIGEVQTLRASISKQKIPTTVDYVRSLGPTKIVLFAEFRETISTLNEIFLDEEWDEGAQCCPLVIHGDTTDAQRTEILSLFNKLSWPVLILQSQVGGLALDGLQVASTGIVHDLPWTADELKQMISRLHRTGQKSNVNLVNILSTSYQEEKMLKGIRAGQDLEEALYG